MKKVSFSDKIDFFIIKNREQLWLIHQMNILFLFFEILVGLCFFYFLYKKNYILSVFFFCLFYWMDIFSDDIKIYDFLLSFF
jgi:hypothetical protein